MIKFFRKIRQRLVKEKKLGSYLTYAVGEVVLVVVGILLALQFNNWNVERENSKKERWYLDNILGDIEYQKKDIIDIISGYESTIQIANDLLSDYREYDGFENIDSLNYKLNTFMIAVRFPNTNNTYQELVNSGQQTLISDKELSLEIIDFYLFSEQIYLYIKNNNDNIFYKEIYPTFYNLHQTNFSELEVSENENLVEFEDEKTNEYLKEKLKDPENRLKLLNALRTNIFLEKEHLNLVKEFLEAGTDLTKQIDDYLGQTLDTIHNND